MRSFLVPLSVLSLLALVSISIGSDAEAQPGKTLLRADQATGTAEQIEAGKLAFVLCAGCHGAAGAGVQGLAPRLNSQNWLATVSNGYLSKTIREGRA